MITAQEKTIAEKLPVTVPGRRIKRRYRLENAALKKRKLALVGLVMTGFLVGVLITLYYTWISMIGYHINQVEKQVAALRIEDAGLGEEVGRLHSFERIETLATQKLGMIKPDDADMLAVSYSKAEKENGPAGREAVKAVGEERKSRFVQAFISMVNRLEGM